MTKTTKLPKPFLASDAKYLPRSRALTTAQAERLPESARYGFEVWMIAGLGPVVPVLLIRKAGRTSKYQDRYYAVSLDSGRSYRVGRGPHVLSCTRIYVRANNVKRLQQVLDTIREGEVRANQIRDRRSSLMMRRYEF